MQTMLATLAVFVIAMAAMAIGVILGGRRLSGSCGGSPGKDCSCSVTERKACEARAVQTTADLYALAEADADAQDRRHHLDIWEERDHDDTLR